MRPIKNIIIKAPIVLKALANNEILLILREYPRVSEITEKYGIRSFILSLRSWYSLRRDKSKCGRR